MRAPAEAALALLAAAWSAAAAAQDDVPRPPRLAAPSATAPAPSAAAPTEGALPSLGALRPPSAATLAPLPEDRAETNAPDERPEEIVVIGQAWRLPDLGSEWRARQAEAAREGRFHATALPLYDPSRPPLRLDPLLSNREAQRHGYIELFRLEFGRRSDE